MKYAVVIEEGPKSLVLMFLTYQVVLPLVNQGPKQSNLFRRL